MRILEYLFTSTELFSTERKLELSSDTGNGFRSIFLFRFYSRVWRRFQKHVRCSFYPPRHAGNPSDGHAARLNTAVEIIKGNGRIDTLAEFADVSQSLVNTHSFVHDDGFEDKESDLKPDDHEPFLEEPEATVEGVSRVGQAEFRWQLPGGAWYAAEDVCRVQVNSGDSRWCILDLNPHATLKTCSPCSNQAQQLLRHGPTDLCPLKQAAATSYAPQQGIQVLASAATKRADAAAQNKVHRNTTDMNTRLLGLVSLI